jgi:hypothetical protein
MRGTWLAQLGQRYLHGETFALVVAPAIADMQFESPAGCMRQAQHYVAIWKAFAGALCCDALADAQSLRDDLPTLATLTLVQFSYYAFFLLLLSGFGTGPVSSNHADQTTVLHAASYVTAVVLFCMIPTAACFWPSRRTHQAHPAE